MTAEDQNSSAELQQVNAELSESLDRCRRIVKDCQSHLIAACTVIRRRPKRRDAR